MRNKIIYFSILLILLVILIIAELNKPRHIDWRYSFSAESKIPYGCYILKDLLSKDETFRIRENIQSLYESLADTNRFSENLIIIADNFGPDETDAGALLDYVKRGNTAFISALDFSGILPDTLKFGSELSFELFPGKKVKQRHFNFTNPYLASKSMFHYAKLANLSYFNSFDSSKAVVLARDSYDKVHFIKIPFGKGFFFIHTIPQIFTNYLILYDNKDYPVKTLSYLTGRSIVWDEYYKPYSTRDINKSKSPLRYILSQESLKTAYFLLLFTVFLFMFFEGKRKQRVIPIYQRPKNTSKEFTEIVTRLYLNRKDNKNLAEKKILHFFDFIASTYYLKPDENDEKFHIHLAEKTGLNTEKTKQLCNAIVKIRSLKYISDHDLAKFVKLLNDIQYVKNNNI
jgi:hypothetical protein